MAVVTPQHRFPLRFEEKVSLESLRRHLGNFDRFLICPESSSPDLPDFHLVRVPDHVLSSEWNYNRYLIDASFYQQFIQYEYILIYQLDCLVFHDNLLYWCDQGWDYVGAPWFHRYENDASGGFWSVGNGGLSLRRVRSHIDVLGSVRRSCCPKDLAQRTPRFTKHPRLRRFYCGVKERLHGYGYKNPRIGKFLQDYTQNPQLHEDLFWSHEAKRFKPDFLIPTAAEAVKFAFECVPQYCFEANGNMLPFGCHAWSKFDRKFWEQHLEASVSST